MQFPEHIANAPTPRTNAQVFTAKAVEGSNANTSKPQPVVMADAMRQLERQLIWAEEVMEKLSTSLEDIGRMPIDEVGWPDYATKALSALNEYKQGTKEPC